VNGRNLSSFDALQFAIRLLQGAWLRIVLLYLVPITVLEVGVVIATRAAVWQLIPFDKIIDRPLVSEVHIAPTLLGIIFILMVLRTICVTFLWARALRQVKFGGVKLSSALFSAYLYWPFTFLMGQERSRIFENLRTASRSVSQEIVSSLLLLISEVMVAMAIILALLILVPTATLILLAWLLFVFGLLLGFVSRQSQHLGEQKWRIFKKLQELDKWTFMQVRNVRLMGQESELTHRHTVLSGQAGELGLRLFLLSTLPRHIGEMALLGSILILFSWFSFLETPPAFIWRDIAVLSVASIRLLAAGQRAVSLTHQLQQKLPSLRDLLDDLQQPRVELPEPVQRRSRSLLFRDTLALKNISFMYENGVSVIPRGTSLHVLRGEWLHVSGPSGSGKTTLVSLLLGLLQPAEGEVSIDGRPVDMLRAMRGGAVAIVPQDAIMVAGTIHENLCFPFPGSHIQSDYASALLKSVGVERSLDERIGEDGAGLSGGQKLKLAIIRALLFKPELLILDEATSQIDCGGEAAIFELIRRELPDATVVVIAHKLSNLMGFDRVWTLHDGVWENRAISLLALRTFGTEETDVDAE
jgi:ABC-type multidrug transport system fused ATPase/permease subunit